MFSVRFNESSFCALRIMGKCTSRHIFPAEDYISNRKNTSNNAGISTTENTTEGIEKNDEFLKVFTCNPSI